MSTLAGLRGSVMARIRKGGASGNSPDSSGHGPAAQGVTSPFNLTPLRSGRFTDPTQEAASGGKKKGFATLLASAGSAIASAGTARSALKDRGGLLLRKGRDIRDKIRAKAAAGGTSWHTAGDDSPTSTESRDRSSQDGDWGHGCLSGASGDWTEDAIAVENEAHTSAGNSTAAEGRSSGVSHQSMVGGPSVAVRVPRAGIFSLRHVQSADADLEKYVMKLGEEWRKDVVDEWRREKGVGGEASWPDGRGRQRARARTGRPETFKSVRGIGGQLSQLSQG